MARPPGLRIGYSEGVGPERVAAWRSLAEDGLLGRECSAVLAEDSAAAQLEMFRLRVDHGVDVGEHSARRVLRRARLFI